jgi:hypothetical protein
MVNQRSKQLPQVDLIAIVLYWTTGVGGHL